MNAKLRKEEKIVLSGDNILLFVNRPGKASVK